MRIKNIDKKELVSVTFNNGQTWVPAFNELGRIMHLIGECEDDKYPNGKGLELVIEFIKEAILTGITYEEFCEVKEIPTKIV